MGIDDEEGKLRRVQLGLKMIALTRLFLKDVNIAATTALQALDKLGREKGLAAGANIFDAYHYDSRTPCKIFAIR